MVEFLNFLFAQFGNIITFLDNFEIIQGLSVLKIFVIVSLFYLALKFVFLSNGGDNE